MATNEVIRVVLVEDDELLRASLASFLELSGFAVTAVGDGLSFYRAIADQAFDVAVVDLGLPDQSGETLIEYLRQNTALPIVVVTARDTLDTRVECYGAGADLFLAKPIDGRELAAAISSLARRRREERRGSEASAPAAAPAERSWIMSAARRSLASPNGRSVALTAREWQLLAAIAANPHRPTDRQALMKLIYGRDDDSAVHALETLVHRTRQKVAESTGTPNVILTDYGVGYRFGGAVVLHD